MKASPSLHSITGVWYVDGLPFGENGILVIMEDGRTVQFQTSITKPRMEQTMRLWHSEFNGERIQFSHSPDASGWYREVKKSGEGWDMIAESDGQVSRFHCIAADPASLPSWYSEMLEKNLLLMGTPEN